MDVTETISGDISIVKVKGSLDANAADNLEAFINNLISAKKIKLIIDLEGVDYTSSSGLRVMLATLKRIKNENGILKVANIQPDVRDIFEISGFTSLFEFYNSEAEALKAF